MLKAERYIKARDALDRAKCPQVATRPTTAASLNSLGGSLPASEIEDTGSNTMRVVMTWPDAAAYGPDYMAIIKGDLLSVRCELYCG